MVVGGAGGVGLGFVYPPVGNHYRNDYGLRVYDCFHRDMWELLLLVSFNAHIFPKSHNTSCKKKNPSSNDTLAVGVISQIAETVESAVPRRSAPETQANKQLSLTTLILQWI